MSENALMHSNKNKFIWFFKSSGKCERVRSFARAVTIAHVGDADMLF